VGGAYGANGERKNMYRLLVGKQEGIRSLERPRHRWVDDIKMELVEIGWDCADKIGLAQDKEKW
jgi:hypothetical protein